MPEGPSYFLYIWSSIAEFLNGSSGTLHALAELIKILGAAASFLALWKLRKIERRYLFKATIPGLVIKIDRSLRTLVVCINESSANQPQLSEALNHLFVDVKSVKRRASGDSVTVAAELLAMMRRAGLERRFWQRDSQSLPSVNVLIEIYGKANGLVRSLENEIDDVTWSSK